MTTDNKALASYIFDWLMIRNGGELNDALQTMTVRSFKDALDELELILRHGGRPPNWTGGYTP